MSKNRYIVLLIISITIFTFSGCSSKETISLINTYAKASSDTQDNILAMYDDAIYQEQQSIYYKALRDGASIKELSPDKVEYSGQQKALKDLANFTSALATISSDDAFEDIDKNSKSLYESALKLSENEYVSKSDITEKDVQLFTSILNAGTKGYIEYKKTKKLKELVLVSDKWVQATLNGLSSDLSAWKRHLYKSLQSRKNLQLLVLNKPYDYCKVKSKEKECQLLSDGFKSKVSLYDEVNQIQKRIDNLDAEFESLSKSITLMSQLHRNIIESMKQDKLDDISRETLKRNFDRLKQLSDSVKEFRKLTQG